MNTIENLLFILELPPIMAGKKQNNNNKKKHMIFCSRHSGTSVGSSAGWWEDVFCMRHWEHCLITLGKDFWCTQIWCWPTSSELFVCVWVSRLWDLENLSGMQCSLSSLALLGWLGCRPLCNRALCFPSLHFWLHSTQIFKWQEATTFPKPWALKNFRQTQPRAYGIPVGESSRDRDQTVLVWARL